MNDLFDSWIYENNWDNSCRYVLGEKGTRPLICIGINPSTAEPGKLDPTLIQVRNRAARLGYDGWMMLNLYPQRATNPDDLTEHINALWAVQNFLIIAKMIKQYNPINIWAAWGTLITKRPFLKGCLGAIIFCTNRAALSPFTVVNWFTIGDRSKDGHPHHPLYLKKDAKSKAFDVNEYLKSIGAKK